MNVMEIVKDTWGTSYQDSVGFQEMVKFYQEATQIQKDKMADLCRNNDWDGFKELIKKSENDIENNNELNWKTSH